MTQPVPVGMKRCLLCAAMAVVMLMSSVRAADAYPFVVLTPQQPASGDSVTCHVVLGQTPTTCVPVCTGSAIIALTPRPHSSVTPFEPWCYPPAWTITCTWDDIKPAQRDTACLETLTEFGFTVPLGTLSTGVYHITLDNKPTDAFTVYPESELPVLCGTVVRAGDGDWMLFDATVRLLQLTMDGDSVTEAVAVDSVTITADQPGYEFACAPGHYRLEADRDGFQANSVDVAVLGDTLVSVSLLPDSAWADITCLVSVDSCFSRRPAQDAIVDVLAPYTDSVLAVDTADSIGARHYLQFSVDYATVWVRVRARAEDFPPIEQLVNITEPISRYVNLVFPAGPCPMSDKTTATTEWNGLEVRATVSEWSPPVPGMDGVEVQGTIRNVGDTTHMLDVDRLCHASHGDYPVRWLWFGDTVTIRDLDSTVHHAAFDSSTFVYCDPYPTTFRLDPGNTLSPCPLYVLFDSTSDSVLVTYTAALVPEAPVTVRFAAPGPGMHSTEGGLATVAGETGVPGSRASVCHGGMLALCTGRPASVRVAVYALDGTLLGSVHELHVDGSAVHMALPGLSGAAGTAVVRIDIDGQVETVPVVAGTRGRARGRP